MENEERTPRKKIFSEEQKAELFRGGEPPLAKSNSKKIEEEILIRVQFKTNLETQYLLNCICKKKKMSRDRLMAEMIRQEAKKENIAVSIHL
nr:hypothetical protein [uncultured Emticicia sp.]